MRNPIRVHIFFDFMLSKDILVSPDYSTRLLISLLDSIKICFEHFLGISLKLSESFEEHSLFFESFFFKLLKYFLVELSCEFLYNWLHLLLNILLFPRFRKWFHWMILFYFRAHSIPFFLDYSLKWLIVHHRYLCCPNHIFQMVSCFNAFRVILLIHHAKQ